MSSSSLQKMYIINPQEFLDRFKNSCKYQELNVKIYGSRMVGSYLILTLRGNNFLDIFVSWKVFENIKTNLQNTYGLAIFPYMWKILPPFTKHEEVHVNETVRTIVDRMIFEIENKEINEVVSQKNTTSKKIKTKKKIK